MNSVNEKCHEKLSTPKRRRLGLRNRVKSTQILDKEVNNSFINSSPVHLRVATTSRAFVPDKCESPPLPCNQVEYLCESANDNSLTDIPCSPGVFESCFFKDVENWESFIAGKNDSSKENIPEEAVDEINNEMFISKLEPSCAQEQIGSNILSGRCEKQLRDEVEESFDVLHQSIININCNNETSTLFETKDSFLLDIRESGIIAEQSNSKNGASKSVFNEINHDVNTFYGLPMIVKGLFKSYRNIEKFYGKYFFSYYLKKSILFFLLYSNNFRLAGRVSQFKSNKRKKELNICFTYKWRKDFSGRSIDVEGGIK